jgi:hypothetical protein
MTAPTNTTKTSAPAGKTAQSGDSTPSEAELPTPSDEQLEELARTQDETAHRFRQLVAGQVLGEVSDREADDERAHRLVSSARQDLLTELRAEEQERARRELAEATRSSEDAVAGIVRGMTTVVRSVVPTALVRPEDVIEATFALADQGLRVSRRLALTVTGGVRSLTPSA